MAELVRRIGGVARARSGERQLFGLIARFALYTAVLLFAVTYLHVHTSVISDLRVLTAKVAAALATGTGISATQIGHTIRLSNRVMLISADCTALPIIATYSALVLAYPIKLALRAQGIAVGIVVISAVNLLRLVGVAWLSLAAPAYFDLVHDLLFQAGMVLVAMAVWAGWLMRARAAHGS